MANFDFVRATLPALHADCVRAELYLTSDPRAAYFEQVRYGMFVRMALIMKLLGAQEPA